MTVGTDSKLFGKVKSQGLTGWLVGWMDGYMDEEKPVQQSKLCWQEPMQCDCERMRDILNQSDISRYLFVFTCKLLVNYIITPCQFVYQCEWAWLMHSLLYTTCCSLVIKTNEV